MSDNRDCKNIWRAIGTEWANVTDRIVLQKTNGLNGVLLSHTSSLTIINVVWGNGILYVILFIFVFNYIFLIKFNKCSLIDKWLNVLNVFVIWLLFCLAQPRSTTNGQSKKKSNKLEVNFNSGNTKHTRKPGVGCFASWHLPLYVEHRIKIYLISLNSHLSRSSHS